MAVQITIPLPEWLEPLYLEANDEEREKIRQLVVFLISGDPTDDERSLTDLMDEIGNNAIARGMTPEILESILNDPDEQ